MTDRITNVWAGKITLYMYFNHLFRSVHLMWTFSLPMEGHKLAALYQQISLWGTLNVGLSFRKCCTYVAVLIIKRFVMSVISSSHKLQGCSLWLSCRIFLVSIHSLCPLLSHQLIISSTETAIRISNWGDNEWQLHYLFKNPYLWSSWPCLHVLCIAFQPHDLLYVCLGLSHCPRTLCGAGILTFLWHH